MTKVIVVGGGVAGSAAALASAQSGAAVTIFEGSERLPANRSLFPYLLSGKFSEEDVHRSNETSVAKSSGVSVKLGERIKRIDLSSRRVQSDGVGLPFDSLVIASGSEYSSDVPKGLSKKGAFVMRGVTDYISLSESSSSISHAVLIGPAPLCLVAASELSSRLKVSAFLGRSGMRRFSPPVRRRIVRAAQERKVALIEAGVEAVAGVRHVEAVLSEGSVLACDAAAVFPNSKPITPELDCSKGSHGGLVVDESMRTSSCGVFAAGDCAEIRLGVGSFPFRLHSSALLMGETAGRNSAGGSARAAISGTTPLEVFGIEVCSAGLTEPEAKSLGLDVKEVESVERITDDAFGDGTSCVSIVFERRTHRVCGLQVAGRGSVSLSDYVSVLVARHATLEEVVQLESAYFPGFIGDLPPIRLTAAKALEGRQGTSEAQGSDL